jgi:hypothetical protein
LVWKIHFLIPVNAQFLIKIIFKQVHAKQQQEENGNGDEKVNGIGGLLPEEEAEDFVIGNPTELVLEQIQKQQKEQENPPVKNK